MKKRLDHNDYKVSIPGWPQFYNFMLEQLFEKGNRQQNPNNKFDITLCNYF